MKIAMPVNKNSFDENSVCISFGRTPYFMIYDTETKERTYLDNSAAASQGGAGIKAAQILADSNIEALLTPRCGENAADVIAAAGIAMYKTSGESIEENINAFVEGQLPALEEVHAGFHNHGGN